MREKIPNWLKVAALVVTALVGLKTLDFVLPWVSAAAECTFPVMAAAKVRVFELKQNVAGGGILTGMRVMASEQIEDTYTQYYADMDAGLVPEDGIDTAPVGNVDYRRKLSKDWTSVSVDCLDEYEAMSQAVWGQAISTVPWMRCTREQGAAQVYCSSNLIYTVTPAAAWAAGIGRDRFIAVE